MAFQKGDPKPRNSGRKKGIKNKKSQRLEEALEDRGCNLADKLAEAIISKDVEMVKALKGVLEFIYPKVTITEDANAQPLNDSPFDAPQSAEELASLIQLAKPTNE